MKVRKIHNLFSGGTSSAFDDIWGWWRADTYTGSSPNIVLTDKSANGRDMTQQAGTITPGTGANGQARMVGGSTAYLTSSATMESWPVTVFTVGKKTNGSTCGFFGHIGGTGYNTLWNGFESSNNFYQYNTGANINADALYGTDECWLSQVGYGSRVAIINGVIKANKGLASIVRSAAIATTIGTQYRGLNFEWQECLVWNRVLTLDEIDEVHAYINTRYGMSIPLWSNYTATPVLWIGGQSNADGRGDRGVADVNMIAPYYGAQSNVNIWENTPTKVYTGHNTSRTTPAPYQSLYFGPEFTMGYDYQASKGGTIGIIKSAIGDTGLAYTAALAAANGFWDPFDNHLTHASTKRCFALAINNWWDSLIVHQAASRKPIIKGLLWYQGETDATDTTAASAYESNIQLFVPQLRQELGTSAKFLLVRIHKDIDIGQHPYRDTVRTAQDTAAPLITNCTEMSVDSYSLRDAAHINAAGQIALGQAAAALL